MEKVVKPRRTTYPTRMTSSTLYKRRSSVVLRPLSLLVPLDPSRPRLRHDVCMTFKRRSVVKMTKVLR